MRFLDRVPIRIVDSCRAPKEGSFSPTAESESRGYFASDLPKFCWECLKSANINVDLPNNGRGLPLVLKSKFDVNNRAGKFAFRVRKYSVFKFVPQKDVSALDAGNVLGGSLSGRRGSGGGVGRRLGIDQAISHDFQLASEQENLSDSYECESERQPSQGFCGDRERSVIRPPFRFVPACSALVSAALLGAENTFRAGIALLGAALAAGRSGAAVRSGQLWSGLTWTASPRLGDELCNAIATAKPIVPERCEAESPKYGADLSAVFSASLDRCSENVVVEAIIISELKFRDVEVQIFFADVVESTDDPTFEDAPEAFDRVRVNCA